MIFVFEVRIKKGYSAERYAAAWMHASKLIQRSPGARGTRLHRKIGDPSVLLAIARWDSKAARDAMEAEADARVREIIAAEAAGCEIRVVGEFEEPEWIVNPDEGESRCAAC